ncbi:hypothetical protein B0H19DRAFT_1145755 [Mycena capillaripes]|nr:hypothetical protein B0H19DRAFT_1145755 [Mycena capillaripes]
MKSDREDGQTPPKRKRFPKIAEPRRILTSTNQKKALLISPVRNPRVSSYAAPLPQHLPTM